MARASAPPVVIVGASLGGLRTAESLRRAGYDGAITVLGDELHPPYNRPPLSKSGLEEAVGLEGVAFGQREATSDVDWRLGNRVVSADLDRQHVRDDVDSTFPYSALIIATGLRPMRLGTQSRARDGQIALRTLSDANELRAKLQPLAHVVIAGAGFLGCEIAATARAMGCRVTIVGSTTFPMQVALGADLASVLMNRHLDRGVEFRMASRVVDVVGDSRVHGVVLDDGSTIPCDVVVEAIGSLPNVEWLNGNDLDLTGGVLTDDSFRAVRSSGGVWDNVYAVGDVARFPNGRAGSEITSIEHWNVATETARRAGEHLARRLAGEVVHTPSPILPSFWSDQYDMHLLSYGVTTGADRIELLEGSPTRDCVFGYYREGELVGVAGLGFRSVLLGYRRRLEAALAARSGSGAA